MPTEPINVSINVSESIVLTKTADANLGHVGAVTSGSATVILAPDATRSGTADLLSGLPAPVAATFTLSGEAGKTVNITFAEQAAITGIGLSNPVYEVDGVPITDPANYTILTGTHVLKVGFTATLNAAFDPAGATPVVDLSVNYN